MRDWQAGAICVAGVLGAMLLACGDDDDGAGGGSGGGGSFTDISQNLAQPSGTLAANNAVGVADAYAQIQSGSSDKRAKQVSNSTLDCEESGTKKTTVSGYTQSSVHAIVSFDACCDSPTCCLDGRADMYYATAATNGYQYCAAHDVTSRCTGSTPHKLAYEGCFTGTGWVFLVKLDGKSYAVNGVYASGTGKLTIKDATASWTCTYTNSKGSCTGGASTISF